MYLRTLLMAMSEYSNLVRISLTHKCCKDNQHHKKTNSWPIQQHSLLFVKAKERLFPGSQKEGAWIEENLGEKRQKTISGVSLHSSMASKGRRWRQALRRLWLVSVGGSATNGVIHKVTRIHYNSDKEWN